MKKRHKGYNYKFTRKKHSARGFFALLLAISSIAVGIAMVAVSFQNRGNGSVYLGSGGVLSLLIALISLILAFLSLKEEGSYKGLPVAATIVSVAAFGGWLAVYALGFF